MKWSSPVLQRLGTWLYPAELLNTKENSSSSPSTRFFSQEAAGGGFEGFVWIACDQTGPLQGFLLTFSIERDWDTSRPSHHYKLCDSQTLVKLQGKIGKVPCVFVCVSNYLYARMTHFPQICWQLSLNYKSSELSPDFYIYVCMYKFIYIYMDIGRMKISQAVFF